MLRFNFNTEFETESGTIHVTAAGRITDYIPATMYRKNGDPGDPAEGGDIEYDEIVAYDENGKEIDFPDSLFDALDDIATDSAEDDCDDCFEEYDED